MKKIFVLIFNMFPVFFVSNLFAQASLLPVYYTPVIMPLSMQNNYYGIFDTKSLAEDLAVLLQQASGKKYQALPMQPGVNKGIFLLLDSTSNYSSNEEGLVETDKKNYIRIKGRYTTGISYAMYSWLEELGFHFYLPGDEWSIVPSIKNIFEQTALTKKYKPYFRLRMFNGSGTSYVVKGLDENKKNEKSWRLWYRRNRMGCDYLRIDGHIGELFNITHRKEIEADTLLVAPINGKRQYASGAKLDPTYKKSTALFSGWIVDEFKKEQASLPGFLPFKKYYSTDAGDGLDYCHTPACEKEFKSISDQAFTIINEAARKIKLTDNRAGVSTLAYTERADTPSIAIEPNVHVEVVGSAFQSVSTTAELISRWSKKTKNISVYDYLNIGVWSYDKPFFNLYQYHNDLLFLKSLKAEGINFETSMSKFGSGIQQYFILKFLCDPYTSIDKVLDNFCHDNFEKAAEPIKKLLKEWYFSDVHLQTLYDMTSFYEDELGRFVKNILDAENTAGLSIAASMRIEELKAYTIYLCKFYELFAELRSLQEISKDASLRSRKAEELLTYTWQLYDTKIFHNSQLNDMLKQFVTGTARTKWDIYTSNHFSEIKINAAEMVRNEFEKIKKKYLRLATPEYTFTDSFFSATAKYSADSILISSMDETAFGNFVYPLQFYCPEPGMLKIKYATGISQSKTKTGKAALAGIESADYSYLKTDLITRQKDNGILLYQIPAKGYYKLYLGQFDATHVDFIIYPGKNLFYHHKKSILMNGLQVQDNSEKKFPNKYLAIYVPQVDSLHFSNLYIASGNTSKIYTANGKNIPIQPSSQPFYNAAFVPKESHDNFIFYENNVYRWPPVLKNIAPYYFFLKYPLK